MPKSVSQLKNEARREEQRENWSRAIELYREAIRRSEQAGDVSLDLSLYNRVGDLHRRRGDDDRAVRCYREAVDHYAEEGLHTSAIALCNKILRHVPDRVEIHRDLARLHAATGLVAEARESLREYCERLGEAGREAERREGLLELAELTEDRALWLETVDEMAAADQREAAREALVERWEAARASGEAAEGLRSRLEELAPEVLEGAGGEAATEAAGPEAPETGDEAAGEPAAETPAGGAATGSGVGSEAGEAPAGETADGTEPAADAGESSREMKELLLELDEAEVGASDREGEAAAGEGPAARMEEPDQDDEAAPGEAAEAGLETAEPGEPRPARTPRYRDPLTGLPNLRLLREEAPRVLARADRDGHQSGLLLLEVRDLEDLRRSLGEAAADRALAGVAERLRGRLRASDLAARVGEDRFAVLLSEVEGRRATAAAADRLHSLFDRPFLLGTEERRLDLHVGLALYPDHGSNLDELLPNAGRALSGRGGESTGRIRVLRSAEDAIPDPDRLAEALREDELELHYQPIVRLPGHGIAGVEALVRWPSESGHVRRAAAVVPLAERSDLVDRLDRWVLERAVARAARWRDEGGPPWIAVNLSWTSLVDPELTRWIDQPCRRHDLDPARIVIEVTERIALRDPERAASAMKSLHQAGVRVALDEFGAEQAAARVGGLELAPMDVDMLVVRGLEDPQVRKEQTPELVHRCADADMELVAEHIESEEELEHVRDAGVELVQGFHTGRPVPAEEIPATAG